MTPGIPQPEGQPLDIKKMLAINRTLNLLCTYLLYDRMHPLEIGTAFEGLIAERHSKFHSEDTNWRDCPNQICVNGRLILENSARQEVELNQLSMELMAKYTVTFQPQIDAATKRLYYIRAKLVERSEVTPAGTIQGANGGLIIP